MGAQQVPVWSSEDQEMLIVLLKQYGIVAVVAIANALWDDLRADSREENDVLPSYG